MKKLLLVFTLMAGFAAHAAAAPTAKAIYCASNTTLYFTYDEVTYNTSTAYDDLDGKIPTKVYDNISSTGYVTYSAYTISTEGNKRYNPTVSNVTNNCPWSKNYRTKCTTVKFLPSFHDWKPTKLDSYFFYMDKITSVIGAENVNTSELTSMNATFFYCKGIKDFSFLSNWDVSSVTNLECTFDVCSGMTNLEFLKNWNVSNVTDMSCIFRACVNISDFTALDNWKDKVSNVVELDEAFTMCYKMEDVDFLADWKFENLKDLSQTFKWCDVLTDISGLSGWNTGTVQLMRGTFQACDALTEVDALSNWDTGNVVDMCSMFDLDISLASIEGLRRWNTKSLQTISHMFYSDGKLASIEPIFDWDTPKLSDMSHAFQNCVSLKGRVDLSNWDLSKFSYEFKWVPYYTTYENYYYSGGFTETFKNCEGLIGVTLGKGTVGNDKFLRVTTTDTFDGCPILRYIDFSGCTDPNGYMASLCRTESGMFHSVPRTCVVYLPTDNGQPTEGDVENVVYTDDSELLQCDKYYSENKVDIELPHRFHADLATYERPGGNTHGAVILPYPVTIQDNSDDEFQPYLLQEEYDDHMFFKGTAKVPANTPFAYLRKNTDEQMTFAMEDVWVESTYDIDGETSDNINPDFAWKAQGFYVNHVIEPEAGQFTIPTMDDYPQTADAVYDYDHVYYIASNRFYRCDDAKLTLYPHRVLFYGMWEKYSGTDPEFTPSSFSFEETGLVDAINEAEMRRIEQKAAGIYDVNGNRLSQMQRGINIVRMSDGSVQKVIMK